MIFPFTSKRIMPLSVVIALVGGGNTIGNNKSLRRLRDMMINSHSQQ
jgi:hypothetical protein